MSGAVLVPGLAADPSCLEPFARALAPRLDRVEVLTLRGHGGEWTDLRSATWSDWVQDAAGAVTAVPGAGPVAIIGQSMGGALALLTAATRPEVTHVVLVNPALKLGFPPPWLLPVLKRVMPSVPHTAREIQDPSVGYEPYPRMPLSAVQEMTRLQAAARRLLPQVTQPVLVFRSLSDGATGRRSVEIVRAGVRSALFVEVPLARSGHIATLDRDSPEIFERTAAFLAGHGDQGSATPEAAD